VRPDQANKLVMHMPRVNMPPPTPQAVTTFVASTLGCEVTGVGPVDSFATDAVYDVDTNRGRFIVKASTSHDALRAEAWACARGAAAGCATPPVIRLGRLGTGMTALIMSHVAGQPIAAGHPAFLKVGADLHRLHRVRMAGFGWLAQPSWDELGTPSLRHPSWPSFLQAICDDTRALTDSYEHAAVVADAAAAAINDHADTLAGVEVGVLCHGDLKAAHILIDAGRLAGVIDWGDAVAADPWWDIARFAHRSDAASVSLLLQGYRPSDPVTTEERAWCLALYEALWTLVDACFAHGQGRRVDATLKGAWDHIERMPR
jgi:aminoglycoside phosphotransferase (APT) family kinase protein